MEQKTKRDKLANPAYNCCSIHSSEVDAKRFIQIKKLWSKWRSKSAHLASLQQSSAVLPLRGVPDFSNMHRRLLCVPTDCEDAKLTKKNTNTSKNVQVLCGQDAIIIVDNTGVLRQRRAFEVPTIPLEHFAEAKNEIVNLENAKDYAETSFNVRPVSSGVFQKGDHDELLSKAVPEIRDSNVARQNTLVHSTPQACLGVTNFPQINDQFTDAIQIDSGYFHIKRFYSASRMLPSMPVPFFTCNRQMSQWRWQMQVVVYRDEERSWIWPWHRSFCRPLQCINADSNTAPSCGLAMQVVQSRISIHIPWTARLHALACVSTLEFVELRLLFPNSTTASIYLQSNTRWNLTAFGSPATLSLQDIQWCEKLATSHR